jgi:hypothetical protein
MSIIQAQLAFGYERLDGKGKGAVELESGAMGVGKGSRVIGVTIQTAADHPAFPTRGVHQLKKSTPCDGGIWPAAFAQTKLSVVAPTHLTIVRGDYGHGAGLRGFLAEGKMSVCYLMRRLILGHTTPTRICRCAPPDVR